MKISISMRRLNIAYTIGCLAVVAASLQGCVKRVENLDNLNVITKPYSLITGSEAGLLYTTNDGELFDLLNSSDDVPVAALGTTGKYILMVKPNNNRLFADDGGEGRNGNHNFNTVFADLNPAAFGNTQMINMPEYNNSNPDSVKDRLYVASSKGIVYNDSNAQSNSRWYTVIDPALQGSTSVTSFAKLDNGTLVAYDNVTGKLYSKENFGANWAALPAQGLGASPSTYIINQVNDIIAVEVGSANLMRSSDGGKTFSALPALPSTDMTCASAVFGKVIVVGTSSHGIYRLNNNTWENTTVGLKEGVSINAMVYKTNKFKKTSANDVDRVGEYVFIATSNGIFRSDDLGFSWIQLKFAGSDKAFTAIN